MLKNGIFVVILLSSLLLSFYPVQAQVVHENPDSLPVHAPYDADRKLVEAMEEMFGSLESFVAHINASDFAASRQDIRLFTLSHTRFAEVYRRVSLTDSDMEAIAEKLAHMPDDLRATVNSSETYSGELEQLAKYTSANDVAGARQLAARMQASYARVSESLGTFGTNSTAILRMLDNSSVDTTGLENGIREMNSYAAKMNESNREPAGLLGSTSLSLMADSSEALTGDRIKLTAVLGAISGIPAGHLVRFFVDGYQVGSVFTDARGVCSIVYEVDGRSFKQTMRAQAKFDPQGESLAPATSNIVEIARWPERSSLQVRATPGVASYADTIYVSGTLTTSYGVPAAGQTVTIALAGIPAGNATTGTDGSYSFLLAVPYDAPAGDTLIQSSYVAAPDSALESSQSPPCAVWIAPGATLVTLEQPPPVFRGGESATFPGTLSSDDGRPITGAKVSVFAGNVLIGLNRTDDGGRFSITAPVPYDITPGDHGVYASFDPGNGRALTGSRSDVFNARFDPVTPLVVVHGVPLLAFPGDELNVTGILLADDGRPLEGRQASIAIPGAAGTVVTDAGGSFQITLKVAGSPGISSVTVGLPGDGLLSSPDYQGGTMWVMPFDKTGSALAVLLILLAAGMVVVKAAGARRPEKHPSLPVPSPAVPGPGNEPVTFSPAEELWMVNQAILAGNDRREAIRSTFLAARRMLRDRDPKLPDSVTHRELCRILSGRQPSLAGPLEVITASYEGVVFGHRPPTDEDVYGALYNLGELQKQLYDREVSS
jgi:hypothetical protein